MKEFRKKNKANKLCTDQKHNWDRKVKVLTLVANGGPVECIHCKTKDKRVLQIHHKLGNGTRDKKYYHKTEVMIRTKSDKDKVPISELEIRCCNCNILAEYEDLKRRYTNIVCFDEDFNPIWRVMPKKIQPLKPLVCDFCGCTYMPKCGKKRVHCFCGKVCYTAFRRKPKL